MDRLSQAMAGASDYFDQLRAETVVAAEAAKDTWSKSPAVTSIVGGTLLLIFIALFLNGRAARKRAEQEKKERLDRDELLKQRDAENETLRLAQEAAAKDAQAAKQSSDETARRVAKAEERLQTIADENKILAEDNRHLRGQNRRLKDELAKAKQTAPAAPTAGQPAPRPQPEPAPRPKAEPAKPSNGHHAPVSGDGGRNLGGNGETDPLEGIGFGIFPGEHSDRYITAVKVLQEVKEELDDPKGNLILDAAAKLVRETANRGVGGRTRKYFDAPDRR